MNSIYFAARRAELEFLENQLRDSDNSVCTKEKKEVVSDWNRFVFWLWLGVKIREHFRGEKCWFELGEEDFGKAKNNPEIKKILDETENIENILDSSKFITFKDKQMLLVRWQKLNNKLFK